MSKKTSGSGDRGKVDELLADLSRRQFLAGVAAATGALALGGCGEGDISEGDPELAQLPDPTRSGIEHVVVVMMENRSFDHFLGWLPGADGMQAGLEYMDKQGAAHQTYALAPGFQNCNLEDPDHSYNGGRKQFNNGAMDGWLRANTDDLFPIGYYVQDDLSFFGSAVPAWTTCDRYFCSILAQTFPNRFYMHAAQTDRLNNALVQAFLPTIWDRLLERGLTGRYYYSDLPILLLWGQKYVDNGVMQPLDTFLADAAAGTLPNVSFVDPRFIGEGQGISNDDHPLADIRNGQTFLNMIYEAVTTSPNWENTVFIVNYDEWGGFYDHVPPPLAPRTELDDMIGNDGRLGFRVPNLVVSPLARRGFVGHQQYDHTSILNMIEWRWGLDSLTVRDATANNIAHLLDFGSSKNLSAPHFDVPSGMFGMECTEAALATRGELMQLRDLARRYGIVPSVR
jgi:phospholipase C